jgi:hypothetical protein
MPSEQLTDPESVIPESVMPEGFSDSGVLLLECCVASRMLFGMGSK